MKMCDSCGSNFKQITNHWNQSKCERPEIPEHIHEILTGLLMGDATVQKPQPSRNRKLPFITVGVKQRKFIKWVDETLGVFGTGNIQKIDDTYCMMYRTSSISHPDIFEYLEWYSSGKKRFPRDLELTPTTAKMWYVTDGCLSKRQGKRPTITFGVKNENNRGEYLEQLFQKQGFNPTHYGDTLGINTKETPRFLDWVGDSVPGYEYKWKIDHSK